MKANLDGVFAVDWEVVRHRNATARPEGQGVVLTVVLHQSWVHAIRGNGGPDRGDPHRETTDLSGGRQVPRHQVWRNRQHLAVVVEPVFVGIVGWQQRGDIEQSRVALRALALERGYYSFLAADKLGEAYAFNNRPLVLEAAAREPLLELPAVQRIGELRFHEEENLAHSEWFKVLQDSDDVEQQQQQPARKRRVVE